jgi:hypothetical protein
MTARPTPRSSATWQNNGWDKDPVIAAIEASKSHRELQKFHGVPASQLVKLPKDAADEAGWKAVYSRLGMPAEAKDYDLSGVKRADGTDVDQALADTLRAALHRGRVARTRRPRWPRRWSSTWTTSPPPT